MTVIELPDGQAAALRVKTAGHGDTLEVWLENLDGGEADSLPCLGLTYPSEVAHVPANGCNPHVLRHSAATTLLREGVSLAGVGAVLACLEGEDLDPETKN